MNPAAAPATPHAHQHGESLVGLMVGLGLGLVVLAAGAQMLAQHLRAHRLALQDSHMHHDLRAVLSTIAHDLQNAQYVGDAWRWRARATCTDAFCDGPEDLGVRGDRIDFSLDRNHNGMQDNNECRGFRLINGEIKARTACQPEVWTALTDAGSIKVLRLSWRVLCEQRGRFWTRRVTMDLSAQWAGDASRQWQHRQTVALRNDIPGERPAHCN